MNEEQGNQGNISTEQGSGIAAAAAQQQAKQTAEQKAKDQANSAPAITWSAIDSIVHSHSNNWYLATAGVLIAIYLLLGVSVFFFRMTFFGAISTGLLATVVYAAFIILARHPANELHYELSEAGIKIEGVLKEFASYRAFGVQQQGNLWRLVLIPTKRFGIQDAIFIPEDKGEAIVDFIGARLPIEEVREDPTEKIFNFIKF